jgi:hypothetical protein
VSWYNINVKEENMGYKAKVIGRKRIENASSGKGGIEVTVITDSDRKIDVVLGSSITIRTDEAGMLALRELLDQASRQLAIDGFPSV